MHDTDTFSDPARIAALEAAARRVQAHLATRGDDRGRIKPEPAPVKPAPKVEPVASHPAPLPLDLPRRPAPLAFSAPPLGRTAPRTNETPMPTHPTPPVPVVAPAPIAPAPVPTVPMGPQPTLRDLRLDRGLTLVDLARLLGVAFSGPGSWERGVYSPGARQWPKLAAARGVTPQEARRAFSESLKQAESRKAGA